MSKGSRKPLTPQDFYLDTEKLDGGVRLPLRGPDGKLTDHWLKVRSVHSDSFQAAVHTEQREQYEADPEALKGKSENEVLKLFRHLLVTDWSFDDFSPDAVKELLDRNPLVAKAVAEVSVSSSLFFPDTGASS